MYNKYSYFVNLNFWRHFSQFLLFIYVSKSMLNDLVNNYEIELHKFHDIGLLNPFSKYE